MRNPLRGRGTCYLPRRYSRNCHRLSWTKLIGVRTASLKKWPRRGCSAKRQKKTLIICTTSAWRVRMATSCRASSKARCRRRRCPLKTRRSRYWPRPGLCRHSPVRVCAGAPTCTRTKCSASTTSWSRGIRTTGSSTYCLIPLSISHAESPNTDRTFSSLSRVT